MYKPPTKEFICKNCGIVFIGERRRDRKVCSLKCSAEFNLKHNNKFGYKKGHQTRVGLKHSKEFIQSRQKEGNPAWKGENATKRSIHSWIQTHFERKNVCEHCNQNKKTDWSHKTHKYSRNREEWQELCRSCHQKYDYANGLRTKRCG